MTCRKLQARGLYATCKRNTGKQKWTATRVDLVFDSNAIFRASAQVYAPAEVCAGFC